MALTLKLPILHVLAARSHGGSSDYSATVARQVRGNLALAHRRLRVATGNLAAAEKAIDLAWANIQTERAAPPTILSDSSDDVRRLTVAADKVARKLMAWRKERGLR